MMYLRIDFHLGLRCRGAPGNNDYENKDNNDDDSDDADDDDDENDDDDDDAAIGDDADDDDDDAYDDRAEDEVIKRRFWACVYSPSRSHQCIVFQLKYNIFVWRCARSPCRSHAHAAALPARHEAAWSSKADAR